MYLRQCACSDSDLKILDDLVDVEKGGLSKRNEVLRGMGYSTKICTFDV
jgi:hypothetical protein